MGKSDGGAKLKKFTNKHCCNSARASKKMFMARQLLAIWYSRLVRSPAQNFPRSSSAATTTLLPSSRALKFTWARSLATTEKAIFPSAPIQPFDGVRHRQHAVGL